MERGPEGCAENGPGRNIGLNDRLFSSGTSQSLLHSKEDPIDQFSTRRILEHEQKESLISQQSLAKLV
jgi:hypothetical protein